MKHALIILVRMSYNTRVLNTYFRMLLIKKNSTKGGTGWRSVGRFQSSYEGNEMFALNYVEWNIALKEEIGQH